MVKIKKGSSKKDIAEQLSKAQSKGFPAHKFTGKIRTRDDALIIQRRLRDD